MEFRHHSRFGNFRSGNFIHIVCNSKQKGHIRDEVRGINTGQYQKKLMDIKDQISTTINDIVEGDFTSIWFLCKLMIIAIGHFLIDHPYKAITGYFMIMLMIQRWHRSRLKTEIKRESLKKEKAERKKSESEAREQKDQENITHIYLEDMRNNMEREGLTGEEPGLKK